MTTYGFYDGLARLREIQAGCVYDPDRITKDTRVKPPIMFTPTRPDHKTTERFRISRHTIDVIKMLLSRYREDVNQDDLLEGCVIEHGRYVRYCPEIGGDYADDYTMGKPVFQRLSALATKHNVDIDRVFRACLLLRLGKIKRKAKAKTDAA